MWVNINNNNKTFEIFILKKIGIQTTLKDLNPIKILMNSNTTKVCYLKRFMVAGTRVTARAFKNEKGKTSIEIILL